MDRPQPTAPITILLHRTRQNLFAVVELAGDEEAASRLGGGHETLCSVRWEIRSHPTALEHAPVLLEEMSGNFSRESFAREGDGACLVSRPEGSLVKKAQEFRKALTSSVLSQAEVKMRDCSLGASRSARARGRFGPGLHGRSHPRHQRAKARSSRARGKVDKLRVTAWHPLLHPAGRPYARQGGKPSA
jgi:hypothetical protein